MVSTAESRHHNELDPNPQPLDPIFKVNADSTNNFSVVSVFYLKIDSGLLILS
ncbi:hypothetical protein ISS30_07735 [bacterium]|nr:hypothetical protein [bacterium]